MHFSIRAPHAPASLGMYPRKPLTPRTSASEPLNTRARQSRTCIVRYVPHKTTHVMHLNTRAPHAPSSLGECITSNNSRHAPQHQHSHSPAWLGMQIQTRNNCISHNKYKHKITSLVTINAYKVNLPFRPPFEIPRKKGHIRQFNITKVKVYK